MLKDVNTALEIRADRLSNLIPHMVNRNGEVSFKFVIAVEHEVKELRNLITITNSVTSEIFSCLFTVGNEAIDLKYNRLTPVEAQERVDYIQVYADSARAAIYQLRYIEKE